MAGRIMRPATSAFDPNPDPDRLRPLPDRPLHGLGGLGEGLRVQLAGGVGRRAHMPVAGRFLGHLQGYARG